MANRKAIIETDKGTFTVELYEDKAPITAGNFIDLVERGFYDGLTFHRYEPNFVIQGGDPEGSGRGGFIDPQTGRERRIKLEVSRDLPHGEAGALAMARTNIPDSASSQFYITLGPAALPADGTASFLAPNSLAIEMATAMPRALNDCVGLSDSSLM